MTQHNHFSSPTFHVERLKCHADARIELTTGNIINFFDGEDKSVPFTRVDQAPLHLDEDSKLLVFKKLAVKPNYGKHGIGLMLCNHAEEMALTNGFDGVILETVEAATWLYNWYVRLGYRTLGKYRYPKSQVETLLMCKPLK